LFFFVSTTIFNVFRQLLTTTHKKNEAADKHEAEKTSTRPKNIKQDIIIIAMNKNLHCLDHTPLYCFRNLWLQ